MICRYFVSVEMAVSFDIISIPKKWLVFMAKCEDPKFVRAGILIRSYVFNGPFIRATKQFYKNRLQAFCTKKEKKHFLWKETTGILQRKNTPLFPSHFSSPLLTSLEGLSVAESCLKKTPESHIQTFKLSIKEDRKHRNI